MTCGTVPQRRWHRHEHAGRHFRILVERSDRGGPLFTIVKIDEAVSPEEVWAVRFSTEQTASDDGWVLEAAARIIARHVAARPS
jgi:hypothetical protein